MKTIILCRHAKSDWDNPLLKDHERPLNDRGLSAASLMGKRLLENHWLPDFIISSYAKRAATTAQLVAQEIHYPMDKIEIYLELYEASILTYLQVINSLSDTYNLVASFGHNPTTSFLIDYLANKNLSDIPTGAMACIEFPFDHWNEISAGTGNLIWYDYPKNESVGMKRKK